MFAEIALHLPLEGTFTYGVPQELQATIQRGCRVLAPFRNKILLGVVVALRATKPPELKRVRSLHDVIDRSPFLPEALLSLTEWIARYYHAPIGPSVHLAVPSVLAPPSGKAQWAKIRDGIEPIETVPLSSDILTLLAEGPMEHNLLRARLPELRSADLDTLEEAGWIQLQQAEKSRKPRTDLRIRATGNMPEKRLGTKQAAVLEFLALHKEVWHSELRDLYQTSRATIRSLADRHLLAFEEVALEYDPLGDSSVVLRHEDPPLTTDQERAVAAIQEEIEAHRQTTFLLHGVTGSGKTEVYVRAIRAARRQGKRAMVLLPEIALTPQFVGVLRACLHEELAIVHSQLTPAQRRSQWHKIRSGKIGVVVGARSSLFAPIEDLGLIIVDEEHDGSFKQHEGVRYNARDAAIVLAHLHGAVTVLGTATPSLETLHNTQIKKYRLLQMPKRVNDRPMPSIELIDLKHDDHSSVQEHGIHVSSLLASALRRTVDAGNQAILFLNRRGFSPEMRCAECGESIACADCERPMTWHKRGNVLMCHACGHSALCPPRCPSCGAAALTTMGAGTERLEHSLTEALDGMRVGRLDRDTSRAKTMETILDDFRNGKLDVLVGTQMVTKGHDFPRVTLVGVLAGDQSLGFADFRSGERTFQLLTQVAGRAGRAEQPGRVLIQTWKPDHPILQAVVNGSYDAMTRFELRGRQRAYLPPYGHVVLLRFHDTDLASLMRCTERTHRWLSQFSPSEVVVGPAVEAPLAKVRDKHRMQIMIHSQQRAPLHDLIPRLKTFLNEDPILHQAKQMGWSIDVDPQQMS